MNSVYYTHFLVIRTTRDKALAKTEVHIVQVQ